VWSGQVNGPREWVRFGAGSGGHGGCADLARGRAGAERGLRFSAQRDRGDRADEPRGQHGRDLREVLLAVAAVEVERVGGAAERTGAWRLARGALCPGERQRDRAAGRGEWRRAEGGGEARVRREQGFHLA